jgi:hypothetical protein
MRHARKLQRRNGLAILSTAACRRLLMSVAAVLLSACGGGSNGDEAIPSELVGNSSMTLDQSDIPPNSPPELLSGEYELVIATEGAADGGPVLAINHSVEGNLEGPGLRIDDDRFVLEDEECAAGPDGSYAFYDNEYRWTLEDSTLTLATVKNECPDRVAETILTSNSWTKES